MNRNKGTVVIIIMLLLIMFTLQGFTQLLPYSVVKQPWEADLGNHRAVLEIENPAQALRLQLMWRRHDADPDERRFIIIGAQSGDTIKNIHRIEVTGEKCDIVFGPVTEKGTYYFYYLPFKPDDAHGFYRYGYLGPEPLPEETWMKKNDFRDHVSKLPEAVPVGLQARTPFDSFYPMEIIPTKDEKRDFLSSFKAEEYLVFPESRRYPIRMQDEIPYKWIAEGMAKKFSGKADRNEYYTLQLGVYAFQKELTNVRLTFSDMNSASARIPKSAMTCFNNGGIDAHGNPFTRKINVPLGKLQPLWVGIDVPEDIAPATYRGTITVAADNAAPKQIEVELEVTSGYLADRGDSELWRHSRLRWLNSRLGIDHLPTAPYTPVQITPTHINGAGQFSLQGKEVTMAENGMPGSIRVWGTEILSAPVNWQVPGEKFSPPVFRKEMEEEGKVAYSWKTESSGFFVMGKQAIESDGYMRYTIRLTARRPAEIKDFRLEIPFRKEVAEYMMGMGVPGTTVPDERTYQAKWDGPHDSFWIGNTYGGLFCEFRGSTYHGPLLNLYRPDYPPAWHNGGKGGFSLERTKGRVLATIYSGQRHLKEGEELSFEFSFLITPVKKIDTPSQFTDRYYHNGKKPWPSAEDVSSGTRVINVHHANRFNPFINYPFIATDEMKQFVDHWHEKEQKVKIYYTIRELTNHVTEIWALRSLGDEILKAGNGGGYPWLQEHFVSDYHPQWYAPLNGGEGAIDASILTSEGDSRWLNYYIEGLNWLVRNIGIDGLYLDDVSFDRRTVKRIRKVLDAAKPGSLLDLHSNTGFSKGPATQYAPYFPYLDKLWFGESFQYDEMPPANWLVEVSGIPFGLMGDMLHAGGNPWRGMVYGMTVRYPWFTEGVNCDPRAIWKIWDDFGIAEAKMTGYWDRDPVVSTSHPQVLATAYVREDAMLVSLASWADEPVKIRLDIDWKAPGLQKDQIVFDAPFIENFQPEASWESGDLIEVAPAKGWLIYVKRIDSL